MVQQQLQGVSVPGQAETLQRNQLVTAHSMASFEGISSQALRRPKAYVSTHVPDGVFSWAAVHQYGAADVGQLKAAVLHGDLLLVSGRKGIAAVNCLTGA